jgi:hypothetical protein
MALRSLSVVASKAEVTHADNERNNTWMSFILMLARCVFDDYVQWIVEFLFE